MKLLLTLTLLLSCAAMGQMKLSQIKFAESIRDDITIYKNNGKVFVRDSTGSTYEIYDLIHKASQWDRARKAQEKIKKEKYGDVDHPSPYPIDWQAIVKMPTRAEKKATATTALGTTVIREYDFITWQDLSETWKEWEKECWNDSQFKGMYGEINMWLNEVHLYSNSQGKMYYHRNPNNFQAFIEFALRRKK